MDVLEQIMSLGRALGCRGTALAFVEVLLFFCAISTLYFVGIAFLYALIAQLAGGAKVSIGAGIGSWFATMPKWLMVAMGVGYLALITLYWVPGDEEQNRAEVRGLVLFLIFAAIVAGFSQRDFVKDVAKTVWDTWSSSRQAGESRLPPRGVESASPSSPAFKSATGAASQPAK